MAYTIAISALPLSSEPIFGPTFSIERTKSSGLFGILLG